MPSSIQSDQIPKVYHFIWLGSRRPFFLIAAIKSVLVRCQDAKVILWTDDDTNLHHIESLIKDLRFSLREIDMKKLIEAIPDEFIKTRVNEILNIAGTRSSMQKTNPVERSKSNLVRYLILLKYGGVYLDADTLMIKDFDMLLQESSGIIGKENSIWPIVRRRNPLHRLIWAPLLEVVRFLAVQIPVGYKWNALYRKMCSSSENNAVMAFTAGHPYLLKCFEYITSMRHEEIIRPLRLGPFLLQRVSKTYDRDDLTTYDEPYFYPYGPMISQHFFRKRRQVESVANYMVRPQTFVLHWGASTRSLGAYTEERIIAGNPKDVFSYLALKVLKDYEQTV
ncbi:MAG: hypothetical protein KI790_10405 [Cyclobacteriaceae bacterium]|nr:hypothetical protein [Cyclobacteriaceae bacterium HetDA_MAG_MS6]